MPDRHTTYRLTLTPATEAALLRLKECGENKQLLSRGHESLKTYLYYTIAWIGYLPLTPWAAWQSMLQDLDQNEAGGGERAGPMLVPLLIGNDGDVRPMSDARSHRRRALRHRRELCAPRLSEQPRRVARAPSQAWSSGPQGTSASGGCRKTSTSSVRSGT